MDRARRPTQPARRFVQGQSLEVTEDHRQTKRSGQPGDLVVEHFHVLASQGRLPDRLDHQLDCGMRPRTGTPHGALFFVLATASEADFRLLGRAEGNSVEPVTQQVGIPDRAGFAGQHEEHRLKGVFGMVKVTQELPADVQHHRSITAHQRGKRRFPRRIAPCVEPLQELSVGESGDGAAFKERLDPPDNRPGYDTCHVTGLSRKNLGSYSFIPSPDTAPSPRILSQGRSKKWKLPQKARRLGYADREATAVNGGWIDGQMV